STLAYQGAGRGLPLDEVRRCNRFATGGVEPDATLLLRLDPERGAQRQRSAGKRPDRMESERADFHRRVAEGYRELAEEVRGVVCIDADGTPGEVELRIRSELAGRFAETFRGRGFT
ncbi:MAG: dTMP kinase, partial [Gemmatimonadota bacterium]|nr:dTMP kinase [Gemmatimonadota bacterium]